jgi:signal transduction histidine kinase/CheY-like chemotaxis protein
MNRFVALVDGALGSQWVNEIELDERIQHVRATASICIVCSIAFSAFNLSAPATQLLGFAELLSLTLFFVPAALLINRPQRIAAAELLLLLGALCISSALIILGGVEGTGLLWVYSVPFLVFFIKGQRLGWVYSLAFFAAHIACVLWIAPGLPYAFAYTPVVRTHFLLSMGFYLLIAAAFNHARSRFEHALHLRKNEAEAASQAKSRFLAAASHDLRQPAHALGLFVARLKQLPHTPQTGELVAGVDASVQALQDMLDNFFDYSRLDAQRSQVELRSFALATVFEQLRTSFSDMAHHKGLRLLIRPTSAWVLSDPVLLHRVLLNLLSNAVQHTQAGGVVLACRPCSEPGQWRIEVRDSGIGIAVEHQQKVFEEFYQVENPQRDRSKGLGLGLSIVERSCKLLEHRVTLRSALGQGSTFALQVPQGVKPMALQAPAAPERGSLPGIEGLRVLLIEDDELGRAALQGLLQSWGCQVLPAVSADAALAQWSHTLLPDFIVSDYRLLGSLNGVDAVHRLRECAGHPVPACIISGDVDSGVQQCIAAAGLVLLQKPVKPAKLRSLLRHASSVAPVASSAEQLA